MSNDLISRSALLEAMKNKYNIADAWGFVYVGLTDGFLTCENLINEQPTAYNVDKVVEQLKNARDKECASSVPKVRMCEAIEIAKAGGLNE